jgi:hypothetical protein
MKRAIVRPPEVRVYYQAIKLILLVAQEQER